MISAGRAVSEEQVAPAQRSLAFRVPVEAARVVPPFLALAVLRRAVALGEDLAVAPVAVRAGEVEEAGAPVAKVVLDAAGYSLCLAWRVWRSSAQTGFASA